jgi:hypothetical protein
VSADRSAATAPTRRRNAATRAFDTSIIAPLGLAADTVVVAVKAVGVGVRDVVDHSEVPVGDVLAIQVRRWRGDADIGIARSAVR